MNIEPIALARFFVRGGLILLTAWTATFATDNAAFAQAIPPPAELRPGVIPGRAPSIPAPPPEFAVPGAPVQPPPPGADAVRFALAGVVVDGATIYGAAELQPLYAAYIGTEITLATLYGIAGNIQAKYRGDGYVLTQAVVPAQKATDGIFHIQVIEGYVAAVKLVGEIGPSRRLAEAYLGKIAGRRPVNIRDIERYLLLTNDLPGITATGVLHPSATQPGAADFVVTAARKMVDGFAQVDNRGSDFTGPIGVSAGIGINSLTRFGERTEIAGFAAPEDNEQAVGQIRYEQRLGSEGFTLGGLLSYGRSEPGESLATLDVESTVLQAELDLAYPFARSRRFNLTATGGFDYIDQDTDVLGTELVSDQLRVLRAGVNLNHRDSFGGANSAEFGIRTGLGVFGASEAGDANLSRAEGDASFTSLNARLGRVQRLGAGFDLMVLVDGQYAFTELLSSEEYTLGNLSFGRGYDPAELSGEHGVGGTAELRFTRRPGAAALENYQLYAFWDSGVVWNTDNSTPAGDERQSLASAGGGLRTNLTDWLSIDLEAAKPLTRKAANRTDGEAWQYYFRVGARF